MNEYMQWHYAVEFVLGDNGYFVHVVGLPGCMSEGDTFVEACKMIVEAMGDWLAVALEDGDPIPEPYPSHGWYPEYDKDGEPMAVVDLQIVRAVALEG